MTTDISPRRLAWLDGELREWQATGLIAADEAAAIRSRYDASRRMPVTRVVLGLGGAFVTIGVIWLVAGNLDRLPPTVRMTAVLALWLGLVALAEVLANRRTGPATAGTALTGTARLLAAGAFGAVVFQAAQSLHVPAYSPSLVGWWAVGALLYAYAVAGLAPLVLGVGVGSLWLIWQSLDGARTTVDFIAAMLLGAVLATAVAVLHGWLAGRGGAPADGDGARQVWPDRADDVWRFASAGLALLALFVAALPVFDEQRLHVQAWLVALAVVVGILVLAGAALGDPVGRLELGVLLAVLGAGALLTTWRPAGEFFQPSPELTGRAVVSVLAYLAVAGWFALLGVRRDLPPLTWLAAAALVVFTTVQSFAVFAPVISGAALFLAVGLVLIGVGFLVERGRRTLVRFGRSRAVDADVKEGEHDA